MEIAPVIEWNFPIHLKQQRRQRLVAGTEQSDLLLDRVASRTLVAGGSTDVLAEQMTLFSERLAGALRELTTIK